MEANDHHILCFAGSDWWLHNPLTEKQWMKELAARGCKVLYVNSIGIGIPSFSSPRAVQRMFNKLKSLARWLRKTKEGVWVLTPFVLPLWSVRGIAAFNAALLHWQIAFIMKLIGMKAPVFWAGLPTPAVMLDRIQASRIVYFIQDNYTAYFDAMRFSKTQEFHETMLRRADAVICSSIAMAEKLGTMNPNIHCIPHGVAGEFFEMKLNAVPPLPEALRNIPPPRIGYWGSLEALQDPQLVAYLAEQRPDLSFVFIGKEMYDTTALRKLPNVHFLGFIPLDKIPAYGIHFDVAMLCFVQSEWIRYSCPVKLREYLALGLPVVSVDIIEAARAFPGEVTVTRSHEEFLAGIETAMRDDAPEKHAHRRALVAGYTWPHTASLVLDILRQPVGRDENE
jgi:glycosyltransferase involved in cell wall biosynthesis